MTEVNCREEWRDVKGWKGYYQISNWGRVKTITRKVRCKSPWGGYREYQVKERILDCAINNNGYVMASFWKPGKHWRGSVHRLVLEHFVGPCPKGMECRHKDGNRENNYINNICWGTKEEQEEDKQKHGRIKRGSEVIGSVLTDKKVLDIRSRYRPGRKGIVKKLSEEYNVSTATIFAIVNRKTWTHI